jgi:TRAP-type C4-dicarboxylate transport system permease small subunit
MGAAVVQIIKQEGFMEEAGNQQEAQAPLGAGMRVYRGLMIGTGLIAAILFGAMALLVCADVLLRNLSITTITWSVEVTEYMLMISAFLASPWLVYTNDHIRVDILVRGLTGKTKWWFDVIGELICLAVCAILAVQSVYSLFDSMQQGGMVFKVLIFPEWWLALPMTISFILLTVEFVRRLAAAFKAEHLGAA